MKKLFLVLILAGYLYPQASNPIPRRVDSLLTYWVNKHETQTITGQKNFMGTVKVGSDTSISLGIIDGSFRTGLTINTLGGHPYGFNRIFKVIPYSSNTASWAMLTGETDFLPDSAGVDHTLNIGSNLDGNLQLPQFGLQLENNYEFSDSGSAVEFFPYYNDLPSPNTTYGVRPFQLGIEKYASGRFVTSLTFSVNRLFIGGTDYLDDRFDFQPMYTGYGGKRGAFFLNDSSWMCNNVNNFGWLYQMNATNNSVKELMRLDNLNNVVISPDGGTHIDLRATIWGSIKWDDKDSTGTVPIYRETGTNRIYVGGTDGMVTNSLEVRSVPSDTTELSPGQIYVNKNTGVLHYTLPQNLLINGDFTDWNGSDKNTVPDNFYSTFDTAHAYVTQSPAGHLKMINDGTTLNQFLSYDSTTVGKTYGYSFVVTQIIDTVRFYIADESGYLLSSTGVYTGVSDEVTTSRNFISLLKGDDNSACEVTLDDIRIWDINSDEIQTTYDFQKSPINAWDISTSKTILLKRVIAASIYDSLFVADVQDSLCVQVYYMDGVTEYDMISSPDTLVAGDTTILFDQNKTPPQGDKVYMKFIYIGDNEADLKSQIYWRE